MGETLKKQTQKAGGNFCSSCFLIGMYEKCADEENCRNKEK